MTITLTVVNVDALPRGGSAFFRSTKPAIRIGREPGLDWTLPDPERHVSGRHCEIVLENGSYWLRDHSTNGVFVNGSSQRARTPHRLAHGDRLIIGRYIIDVAISLDPERETAVSGPGKIPPPAPEQSWAPGPGFQAKDTSATGLGDAGITTSRHGTWPDNAGHTGRLEGIDPTGANRSRPDIPSNTATAPLKQTAATADDLLAQFCLGAGIPPETFAGRDRGAVAFEIGEIVRLTAENLGELLKARAAAKAMAKSPDRTMIGAADNNPLKFVPAAAEALEIMFAQKRSGYLDSRQSLQEAFSDLREHERATYVAMQKALARLLDEIAPDTIEKMIEGSAILSKKGRAWDLFVRRWETRSAGENGMLDTFLAYFAEAYEDATASKKSPRP